MTEITHEALEALIREIAERQKKKPVIPWFVHAREIVRTGQLIHAVPSGDEVDAVARSLYEEDDPWCKAWPWPNLQPDQGSPDAYRRLATAAITTYEAVSGVAKMREALKKAESALAEAVEEERGRIDSMRGAVLERTTTRDLAAVTEWQSAVDAARAALGEKP